MPTPPNRDCVPQCVPTASHRVPSPSLRPDNLSASPSPLSYGGDALNGTHSRPRPGIRTH